MTNPVPAARRSLRSAIVMAGLVVAGAAILVLLLGLISDQDGGAETSTPSPAPIIFPTYETRNQVGENGP